MFSAFLLGATSSNSHPPTTSHQPPSWQRAGNQTAPPVPQAGMRAARTRLDVVVSSGCCKCWRSGRVGGEVVCLIVLVAVLGLSRVVGLREVGADLYVAHLP